ncbi:Protein of unknown function [Quadrisphaera granulorum]|uniref:Uncharacterized protein DUF2550 n=1 Tax=Quadrisphaera granulorum TaxID=317664 RepID=A0A316AET6_9ACTN|nr:DUF2550 domain-containing protein [Quadrisphaera granulorum]PWJ56296.1 uncharacterized protein DUF2550 [Quadrisphaera granulorum]SZE94930.1 Protein of unknown function [Quadrisphaera granulorum]
MPLDVLLLDAAIAAASVLVLLGLLLLGVALRRRALVSVPGSFECSVRRRGRAWSSGIGRFGSHHVQWWGVISLRPGPRSTWARTDLEVVGRRAPSAEESVSLQPGDVVVRCTHRGACLELGMTSDAATGFISWLEAAPPGSPEGRPAL